MNNPKAKINSQSGINAAINRGLAYRNMDITNEHVSISAGNKKLGVVANISLPPVITCANCSGCKEFCYAVRSFNRLGDNNVWVKNLAIYKKDSARYFEEINKACYIYRFFRWHVSGDIVDSNYLLGMVNVATDNAHCEFLAFTKNYSVVNAYLDNGGNIPSNLHILFSAAPGVNLNNPYSLPECHINFEDEALNTFKGCSGIAYHCTGNCEECIAKGCGCFNLRNGDVTIINQH